MLVPKSQASTAKNTVLDRVDSPNSLLDVLELAQANRAAVLERRSIFAHLLVRAQALRRPEGSADGVAHFWRAEVGHFPIALKAIETIASGAPNSLSGCLFWRKLLSPGVLQLGFGTAGIEPSSSTLVM